MNPAAINEAISRLENALDLLAGVAERLTGSVRRTEAGLLPLLGSATPMEAGSLFAAVRSSVEGAHQVVAARVDDELAWLSQVLERAEVAAARQTGRAPQRPAMARVGTVRPPTVVAVEPDQLTDLFNAYADASTDATRWTGADSTYSVPLPDGRVVWIFSDTFLGPVLSDGSRPELTKDGPLSLLTNSLVVQDGAQLSTPLRLRRGSQSRRPRPSAIVATTDLGGGRGCLWAGDGLVVNDEVEIMYRRYAGMHFTGTTAVARFDPGDLRRPTGVVALPGQSPVAWGSAARQVDGFTYVYGAEETPDGKRMHVARVEGESFLGRWEYRTSGGGWSSHARESAPVLDAVSNEFSVSPFGDGYLLVTHDTTTPLSPDIVGYVGATPFGPFEQKTLLYTTPETGVGGSYGSPRVYTHNAHAHPHVDRGSDGLLVSYNVHAWPAPGEPVGVNNADLFGDVSIFRPRFVTVRFDGRPLAQAAA